MRYIKKFYFKILFLTFKNIYCVICKIYGNKLKKNKIKKNNIFIFNDLLIFFFIIVFTSNIIVFLFIFTLFIQLESDM